MKYYYCDKVTKVEYIQYLKKVPSEEGKQAELALFRRLPDEAVSYILYCILITIIINFVIYYYYQERILLQATPPLVYRAIKMNIDIFKW